MAVSKRFADGVQELQEIVGSGTVTGKLVVDQAYAQRQHETMSYSHDDGEAQFLQLALEQGAPGYLQSIADNVLQGGVISGMIEAMEALNDIMKPQTPELAGDLSDSGNPIVLDNGSEVYNRPPSQQRLTAEAIRDKHRRRS